MVLQCTLNHNHIQIMFGGVDEMVISRALRRLHAMRCMSAHHCAQTSCACCIALPPSFIETPLWQMLRW